MTLGRQAPGPAAAGAGARNAMPGARGRLALVALLMAAALIGACSGTDRGTTVPPATGAPTPATGASPSGAATATPAIPGAPTRPTGPTERAALVRVVDGDTIRVRIDGREERVRYIGMDTPELNLGNPATPEPYAVAATEANARLLAGGSLVLERDVSERDRYGRLLRNVWLEAGGRWTLVNLALVAEGFAAVATFPPDVKYVDALLAAQRAARKAGRGLWGGATP